MLFPGSLFKQELTISSQLPIADSLMALLLFYILPIFLLESAACHPTLVVCLLQDSCRQCMFCAFKKNETLSHNTLISQTPSQHLNAH